MSTNRFHRTVLETAKQEASAVGGRVEYEHSSRGGYSHLLIYVRDRWKKISLSTTPRNWDTAVWNAEREVRRAIREMLS